MKDNPRYRAVQLFLTWEKTEHTLDWCIQQMQVDLDGLSPKDRRLFNAIVFGVFRHRAQLDWLISKHATRSIQKIELQVLYILRTGMLQLYLMNKIPDFAAIDTCVSLAKQFAGKNSSGFVNAVLRSATRESTQLPDPDKTKITAKNIHFHYSIPKWLAKKWVDQFGFKPTCNLAAQINRIPAITLRTNTLKTTRPELVQALDPLCDGPDKTTVSSIGIQISHPAVPLHKMQPFTQGWFQVQDEAAQIVTQILDPQPKERILDAYAGLGGKTHHIAQTMQNSGSITAVDINPGKLTALENESRRLGVTNITHHVIDILKTTVKEFNGYFDRVLVDAPCTGLGVLKKNPDTKWRRKKSDILRMAARQKKILNACANLLKPDGVLVYAVCSCEKEENEEVLFSFLSKRKDFSIDKEFKSDTFVSLMTQDGFFKTYPDIINMDGFFVARLKRN